MIKEGFTNSVNMVPLEGVFAISMVIVVIQLKHINFLVFLTNYRLTEMTYNKSSTQIAFCGTPERLKRFNLNVSKKTRGPEELTVN